VVSAEQSVNEVCGVSRACSEPEGPQGEVVLQDEVVLLVRLGLSALAEALELLDPPAREDLRALLELPDVRGLNRVAAAAAHVVSRARGGLRVHQAPLVVRGAPWLPEEPQPSLFPPSTSGGTTERRRS